MAKLGTAKSESYVLYRKTVNRVAFTMIVFFALINLLGIVGGIIVSLGNSLLREDVAPVFSEAISGIVYILSFMLPVIFFKHIYPSVEYHPLAAKPVLPKGLSAYLFLVVGVNYSASVINSLIMQIFFSVFGFTVNLPETEITGAWSVVMLFITTAVIPSFVEEFLFRGVFLKNLLPFGKTTAVVVSAFMFALMHQNFLQFFYTFVSGLLLGWVFLKSGSIWACVLAHMLNNGFAVLQEVICHYLDDYSGNIVSYGMMIAALFAGFLALCVILKSDAKKCGVRRGNVFGSTERIPAPSGSVALTDREAVKGFFSPAVIAATVISILLALLIIYSYGVPIEAVQ